MPAVPRSCRRPPPQRLRRATSASASSCASSEARNTTAAAPATAQYCPARSCGNAPGSTVTASSSAMIARMTPTDQCASHRNADDPAQPHSLLHRSLTSCGRCIHNAALPRPGARDDVPVTPGPPAARQPGDCPGPDRSARGGLARCERQRDIRRQIAHHVGKLDAVGAGNRAIRT